MVHRLQSELQRAREAAEGPSVELARQRALTAHLERELQVLEAVCVPAGHASACVRALVCGWVHMVLRTFCACTVLMG